MYQSIIYSAFLPLLWTGEDDTSARSQKLLDRIEDKEMFSVIHSALVKSQTNSCWLDAIGSLLRQSHDGEPLSDPGAPPGCERLGFGIHNATVPMADSVNALRQEVALAFTNCQLQEDGLQTYSSIESLVAAQNMDTYEAPRDNKDVRDYATMLAVLKSSQAKMAYGVYTQYRLHLLSLCRYLENQSASFATQKAMHDLQGVTAESSRVLGDALNSIHNIEETQNSISEKSREIHMNIAETEKHENQRQNQMQQSVESLLSSVERFGREHVTTTELQREQTTNVMSALSGIFETASDLINVVESISRDAEHILNATSVTSRAIDSIQSEQARSAQFVLRNLNASEAISVQQNNMMDSFDTLRSLASEIAAKHAFISAQTTETTTKIADLDRKLAESFRNGTQILQQLHTAVHIARDQTAENTKTLLQNQQLVQKWIAAMQKFQYNMGGKVLQFDALRFYAISWLLFHLLTSIESLRGARCACLVTLLLGWFSESYCVDPLTNKITELSDRIGTSFFEFSLVYRSFLWIVCTSALWLTAKFYRSPDQKIRQVLKDEIKVFLIQEGHVARALRRSMSIVREASMPIHNQCERFYRTSCSGWMETLKRFFILYMRRWFNVKFRYSETPMHEEYGRSKSLDTRFSVPRRWDSRSLSPDVILPSDLSKVRPIYDDAFLAARSIPRERRPRISFSNSIHERGVEPRSPTPYPVDYVVRNDEQRTSSQ